MSTPPPLAGETFVAYLRRATGQSVQQLAAQLDITPDFLIVVSDNGAVMPQKASVEICRRANRARGLDESLLLSVLSRSSTAPMSQAASRKKPFARGTTTYIDLVRGSSMDEILKRYWLDLA